MNWRCFHCDEVFTTEESAKLHFGPTERHKPACTIDIAEYRAMEQRMLAYNEEDAEVHRHLQARLSDHQLALVREEERGYSRGLQERRDDLPFLPQGPYRMTTPIDMVLFCPECNTQHIDAPKVGEPDWDSMPDPPSSETPPEEVAEFTVAYHKWWRDNGWNNPPHRSHLCGACGHIWRPADVPTNGVAAVQTRGADDSPIAKGNPWRVGQFVTDGHGPARVTSLALHYGFAYTYAQPRSLGPRYGTVYGGTVYDCSNWKTYHEQNNSQT